MSGLSAGLSYFASFAIALILQLVALPGAMSALRPLWLPIVLAHWALHTPERPNLSAALLFGLINDALLNSTFGSHALALLLVTYASARLRPLLTLASRWQIALALAPVWVGYAAVMTGLDAVTHHATAPLLRWLPVVVTVPVWVPVSLLLLRVTPVEPAS